MTQGTKPRSSKLPLEPTAAPHPLLHEGWVARVECAEDWEDLVPDERLTNCGRDPVPLHRVF